jgi:hypothetical protein
MDTVLSSNFGKIDGNLIPAASYFEHLRLLIRLIRAASRNEKSAAARAMASLNLSPPLLISQSRLEILVPQKRAELLYAATRLCELEAGTIMNAMLDAGVTHSSDLRPLEGSHLALHEFWGQLPASRPALRKRRSNKTGIERRPRSRRYVEREWERVSSKARRVNAWASLKPVTSVVGKLTRRTVSRAMNLIAVPVTQGSSSVSNAILAEYFQEFYDAKRIRFVVHANWANRASAVSELG